MSALDEPNQQGSGPLNAGPLRMEVAARRAWVDGEELPLTRTEFDILALLLQQLGSAVSRERFQRSIWGEDVHVTPRVVDTHVATLRKKLRRSGNGDELIETVRGYGYRFALVDAVTTGDSATESTWAIAVMPFADLTPTRSVDRICEGLAEQLIHSLTHIEDLHVTARGSTIPLRDSPAEVGRRLGVRLIVSGSVQQAADRLRITVQITDVARQKHVWSERFDRLESELLLVQDEISQSVGARLALIAGLGSDPVRPRRATENMDSYVEYLEGLRAVDRRTRRDIQAAIGHFERALRYDAGNARAHAALADCWTLLVSAGYRVDRPGETARRARRHAESALEIDPDLAEARAALAFHLFRVDWDWAGADREFRRAIERQPGLASARHWYAVYLAAMGRFAEALSQVRLARRLDPLSPSVHAAAARVLHFSGLEQAAAEECRSLLLANPDFGEAHFDLGMALLSQGHPTDALREVRRATELAPGRSILDAVAAHVQARAGHLRAAQEAVDRFERPFHKALVLAGLGEIERALVCLEQALRDRDGLLVYLKVEPMFDALRVSPGFHRLLERLGLSD